jgi:hypothetical protein
VNDCSLLQMDIETMRNWCTANYVKFNVGKTKTIYFTRKTNIIAFKCKHCESRINRTDTIKDLGVFLDSKLYFNQHVDYIFSQASKLCLIRAITFSFSSVDSLLLLYFTLVRSKLEYFFRCMKYFNFCCHQQA